MHIASQTQLRTPRLAFSSQTAAAPDGAQHDHDNNTIIGVPFESTQPMRSMLADQRVATVVPDFRSHRLFKIRAADSYGQRSSASILLDRMYATRGYKSNGVPAQSAPNRVTLTACEHDDTMGTITVGFDSGAGLCVDELFGEEVDMLRAQGRKVCEFTKLAMDSLVRSRKVLASLFHVAYIYAHRLNGFQDLLIEVNPRHVRYYERMLGFVVKGAERLCPRVNAPAVLMALDFQHAHDQIERFGGLQHLAEDERSLYPYFFSVGEEAGIVGRLARA